MSEAATASGGTHTPDVWVFHSGALGDCVLIWPLLRAMSRGGHRVTLVARHSHAALARDWLGAAITIRAIEHPDFDGLWRGEAFEPPDMDPCDIISFLTDDSTPSGCAWLQAAKHSLRARAVWSPGHPDTGARAVVWDLFHVEQLGAVEPHEHSDGAVVLHVGAGSRTKSWPLERWLTARAALESRGARTAVIAGEVELERFSASDRRRFDAISGQFILSLDTLAHVLSTARLVVAADTGPAHLAAQLGVPTIALFGPTDPRAWAPVGPCVRVLAPDARENASDMTWLAPESVVEAAREFITP